MKVFKYPLAFSNAQEVVMPKGAKPLYADMQHGTPCLWAIVDPNAEPEKRTFGIYGTGHEPPEWTYVDSMLDRAFVWHVFEMPRPR